MGALNMELLQTLYQAARGVSTDAQTRTKNKVIDPKIKEHFRVYFPTEETVLNSLAGYAGTICFQEDWYHRPTFPKSVFRDYISTRNGLLSHNKIMLGHTPTKAWAYVGSANLSESAWGKIVRDAKRKENKLVCRNWECGVLVPVASSAKSDGKDASAASATAAAAGQKGKSLKERFRGCLDVPFEIPAPTYGDRDPWFFKKGEPARRF
jgi:hypothetical protein